MVAMNRIRVSMTGFPGAPGLMSFYCNDAATFLPPLHTFLTSMANAMPSDVTLIFPNIGDVLESTTGQITGQWAAAQQSPIVGTQTAAYAAPVGFLVGWETPAFLSGRRLRGRTYIVPATNASFSLDGTLAATSVVGIKGDADAFVAATTGNFLIWQRPRLARAASGTLPALPARVGGYATVSGSRVPDKCVVLRSRRD